MVGFKKKNLTKNEIEKKLKNQYTKLIAFKVYEVNFKCNKSLGELSEV
jgi:hypothetical protein